MEQSDSVNSIITKLHSDIDLALKTAIDEQKSAWEEEKSKEVAALEEAKKEWEKKESNERAALDAERAAWEVEKARIAEVGTFGQKIKLDVGGRKFTTTMTTLQRFPDSMLGAMFSGRHALSLDEDGCYFIDRDGRHFHHILNFLRDPEHFSIEEVTGTAKSELVKEASYYGLHELMNPFTPISQSVNVDLGSWGAHYSYTMELTQQLRNAQWFAVSTPLGVFKQPVQYCRHCGAGVIIHSNGVHWCGVSTFATNRSIPDHQPTPTAACLVCHQASA